jgi:Ca-activated chloride channel family protein
MGNLLLVGVIGTAVVSVAAQRPAFRSAIDLVLLNVTVTGADGRYIADLGAEDFQVLENGRPQQLAFFSTASAPLSVSLLVDTSSSMDEEILQAHQAAMEFITRLRPGDLAEVVSFDSRVEVLQPLTSDRSLLEAAIRRLRAGGSTALYNAVYVTLRALSKAQPASADEIRRQAIVVLSDGEDTTSVVTFDQLLDTAKRSQTVIYAIGLGLEISQTKRAEGEFSLRQLAQATGGRLFLPKRPEDLAGVYNLIATEISSQYVLGFQSNNSGNGGWRQLAVRVQRPNLQARTRTGYYTSSALP